MNHQRPARLTALLWLFVPLSVVAGLALAEKQLPVHASYGPLLISTFARMGADTRHLWQDFQAIDSDANETLFQRDVKSARTTGCFCRV